MSTIPDFKNKEKIILNDYLALERTRLANERTFFSFLRTSLYLVLAGIAFFQLHEFEELTWLGFVSIFFGIVFFVTGIFTYFRLKNKLNKFYSQIPNEETEEG
jgi:putative membrane protein